VSDRVQKMNRAEVRENKRKHTKPRNPPNNCLENEEEKEDHERCIRWVEVATEKSDGDMVAGLVAVLRESTRPRMGDCMPGCLYQLLPYTEYLKTHHWQMKRKKAMYEAGYRCQLCNSEGELHIHHRTYERVGCEKDADLVCLCAPCHKVFHENRTAEGQRT
jgi:hypothetical protein